MTPPLLLAARGITRRFGGFTALDSVDFDVQPGEIHALLGENGAGKSTLMNVLSGLMRPTSGEILLAGKPVRFRSPQEASAAGIGMVHQHFLLVPPLSVRENLLLGASPDKGGPLSYPAQAVVAEAQAIAERLGWRHIPWSQPAGDLPVGTQQRVEILKALRGAGRVLIFDEPTAVLSPTETPELFATLRALAAEGRGIVFISHKLQEVLSLAGRVTVLRRGKVVHRTTTGETDTVKLAEAMVGGAEAPVPPFGPHPRPLYRNGRGEPATETTPASHENKGNQASSEAGAANVTGPPLPELGEGPGVRTHFLQVTNLNLGGEGRNTRARLRNITFSVAAGEIFGIAGVDGNGQTELAACLSGLVRADAGEVRVGGELPLANAAAFRRAGVAVIPADRHRHGLALTLSLTENVALGMFDAPAYRRGPLLLWPRLHRQSGELIRQYDVRASGPRVPARALSGGNQQKLVIARALSGKPRVVVAVNPTRGLDVGAMGFVHEALREARNQGAAVVLLSTELDEMLALSDRIAVMYEGAFSGVVSPDAPREEIGLLMGGGGGNGERAKPSA